MGVDLLTQLDRVKGMIGKSLTSAADARDDFFLRMLITQVSSEIADSCGRTHFLVSNPANPVTQFYGGTGSGALALDQWPLYTPVLAGNTISGSAVVSGLSSTAGLFVGQGVTGLAFAPPTTSPPVTPPLSILSVNSATQVTLNGTASLTATQTPVGFGVQVWWNDAGYGTPGNFQDANLLAEGGDYRIDRDRPDGTCKSGLLYSICGGWVPGWASGGYWSGYGPDLTATQAPGSGNYQVKAAIGYASVPYNLEMAAIWCVMKARFLRPWGLFLQSESDDGYSYSLGQLKQLGQNAVHLGLLDDYVGAILNKFRITPVAV